MVPVFFRGLSAEEINAAMIGASQQVLDPNYIDEIMSDMAQATREIVAMPYGSSHTTASILMASRPIAQKLVHQ